MEEEASEDGGSAPLLPPSSAGSLTNSGERAGSECGDTSSCRYLHGTERYK
jgi:hypothetical protein